MSTTSNSETLLFHSEKIYSEFKLPTEEAADSDDTDQDQYQQVLDHVDQEERIGDNFEEERFEKCVIIVSSNSSSLEIKVGELLLFKNVNNSTKEDEDEDHEEGLRTPTSLHQRIPLVLTCPPAPMKPMSLPSKKRKTPSRRRVLLDCSDEIQSFFGQNLIHHHDFGANYKIKKPCKGRS